MATLIEPIGLGLCLYLWLSTAVDSAATPESNSMKGLNWEHQIIGGGNSLEGEFPFMARLYMKDPFMFNGKACGGSVIDEWHILTAAHCVVYGPNLYKENYKKALKVWNPNYIAIELGCHDLWTCGREGKPYAVSRVMAHHALGKDLANDIALLRSKTKFKFNNKTGLGAIRPVKIASSVDRCCDEKPVITTAVGWGRAGEPEPYTTVLQKVDLETQTREQCKKHYPHINEGVICAGNITKSPCTGDSGGPLLRKLRDKSLLQVAVFSFIDTERCVDEKGAGFTKIAHYRQWINDCIENRDCEVLTTRGIYPSSKGSWKAAMGSD